MIDATSIDERNATLVQAISGAAAGHMSLEIALAALAEEQDDRRLANVARRLAEQLQQGRSMEQALDNLGRQLPMEIGGLLRAGIESGDLAGTFERYAAQRLVMQRIGRRIRAAIAYPILIATLLVPLLLFVSLYVIPMFVEIFNEFSLQLPAVTLFVLATSRQLPGLVAGVVLFLIAIPIALRLFGGRWLFHRVRSATPLIGRLWVWSNQHEFAAMLASFLDLRLPMTSAVAHTGEVASDRNMAGACRRVCQRLQSGQSLSSSLSQSIHFDRTLVSLTAWGEAHNLLPEALRISTEIFEDRIERRASLIQRLLPPITLIAVGILVLSIVVSLMLPLVQMIQQLSM
jgi:type II secretory pathway component PulF